MNRTKLSTIILGAAAVLAIVAGLLSVQVLTAATNSVSVVVSNIDIGPFEKISTTALKVEKIPKSAVKKGMFADVSGVTGKYSRTYIPAGTYITEAMLTNKTEAMLTTKADPKTNNNPLTMRLSEQKDGEKRAMTIPVNQVQGLGGKLVPGDRVDVIGSLKIPVKAGSPEPVAKILARSVLVLDVLGEQPQPVGVTVSLTPAQAQDTVFALLNGQVYLALNPYNSNLKASETQTTNSQTFISNYISPASQTQAPVNQVPVSQLPPLNG